VTAVAQRRLWLAAGWLTIGYVVLTFIGTVFQEMEVLGDKPSKAAAALVTSSMSKNFTGGYIDLIATLVFLAAALLLARLLRGSDDLSGWLSSCVSGAAVAYVAVMFATGAAGAAALYDGHHGVPLATVTALSDIRNIGYSMTGGIAGALVLAASAAGQVTRVLPRWFVYAGYLIGAVCIAAVPAVKAGAPQTLLWFAWLVAVGVIALRRSRVVQGAARTVAATA
jgi:hypothetical protein